MQSLTNKVLCRLCTEQFGAHNISHQHWSSSRPLISSHPPDRPPDKSFSLPSPPPLPLQLCRLASVPVQSAFCHITAQSACQRVCTLTPVQCRKHFLTCSVQPSGVLLRLHDAILKTFMTSLRGCLLSSDSLTACHGQMSGCDLPRAAKCMPSCCTSAGELAMHNCISLCHVGALLWPVSSQL